MIESTIIACCPFGTGGTRRACCGVIEVCTTRRLTDQDFASAVMAEERAVLLEFWAPWCEACSQLDGLMDSLVAAHRDRLVWIRANVEDCSSLRKRFGIAFLPTLIVLLKGTEVERIQGIPSAEQLHSIITRVLPSCPP